MSGFYVATNKAGSTASGKAPLAAAFNFRGTSVGQGCSKESPQPSDWVYRTLASQAREIPQFPFFLAPGIEANTKAALYSYRNETVRGGCSTRGTEQLEKICLILLFWRVLWSTQEDSPGGPPAISLGCVILGLPCLLSNVLS